MSYKVAVLDMQPIDPPTGGGRLRLLGLYHDLGPEMDARYVGTYDWPGPGFRRQMLSPTLEEMMVPLSAAHFAAAEARSKAAGGRVVIDSTFHELASLSPDYVAAAREAAATADIVVFSHPWVYPLVSDVLDSGRQLIVYDSHNVEALLRMELLDDGAVGTEVVRGVVAVEYALCHKARLILACSQEDRLAFARLYGVAIERIRVIPNGTFVKKLTPPNQVERARARSAFGLNEEQQVALFIGSNYGPNAEAARFIAATLSPALPAIKFVVAGGVGESLDGMPLGANLRRTGTLSEDEKRDWLHAADLAINPMFAGSGTNIKMFDYMAAGLPIVSTCIGARGIEAGHDLIAIADRANFSAKVSSLLADPGHAAVGRAARDRVEKSYSWERISRDLGCLMARRRARLSTRQPFFSVIVPTYERPASLTRLVECLSRQTWRDFEVIIVDQSKAPWSERSRDFGIDIEYVLTDLPGAVYARNRGAALAAGQVLAFIDDDCEPALGWLEAAHREFSTRDIAGLEGLITSNRVDDAEWRAVTNDGFQGIGFMTANLFLRAAVFDSIDGFDVAFDHPHFREDTDIGWRALDLGEIPFSREAWVYHPPQPRSNPRESLAVRSQFFEKDALLLRKHPVRCVELIRRECQWTNNPHYWKYFLSGLERYQVRLPGEVRAMIPEHLRPR